MSSGFQPASCRRASTLPIMKSYREPQFVSRPDRPCIVADDQWAVVPRVWASAYFGHCRAPRGPTEAASSLRLPDVQSTEALYYREWAGNKYCRDGSCTKCSEAQNVSDFAANPSILTGTCTEVILTRRLQDLGVSFSVAPYDFHCRHWDPKLELRQLPRNTTRFC